MVQKKSNIQRLRSLIQFVFFAFVVVIFSLHSLNEAGVVAMTVPGVHALCPLGGFETLYSYITQGTYLKKIQASSLILSGIIFIMALLVGRFFCGWICPFGTLDMYMTKLGKFLGIKGIKVPVKIDKILKMLKYVVLFLTILFTWALGTLVLADYDPWAAFAHLPGLPESYSEMPIAFIILALVLLGAIFIKRFFCRYLCPLGALQAILAKIGIVKIERDINACINCGACTRNCPVGIDVANSEVVDTKECINCLNCVTDSCPQGVAAIQLKSFYNKKGTVVTYILIAFLVFYGFYGTAKVTGVWEASYNITKVAAEGELSTDAIRGSTEIKEGLAVFGIAKDDFYTRVNLPKDYSEHSKFKDIVDYLQINGYPEASMSWIRDALGDPDFNLESYALTASEEEEREKK